MGYRFYAFLAGLIPAAFLAGCGLMYWPMTPSLSRSDALRFTVGTTTKADVVSALGTPFISDMGSVEGRPLRELTYGYSDIFAPTNRGAKRASRLLFLYFSSDVLVSIMYCSSFATDPMEYDRSLCLNMRERGLLTRTDIRRVFGPPHGEAIYPVTKETGATEDTYCTIRPPAETGENDRVEVVHVLYDANGGFVGCVVD